MRMQRRFLPLFPCKCPKIGCVYNEGLKHICKEPRINKYNSDSQCYKMSNKAVLKMLTSLSDGKSLLR